jgi:hypothetical protein
MRKMILRLVAGCSLCLSFLVLSGCGGSTGVTVSGKVSLDGAAVPSGRISFMPVDTKSGQAVGGEIINGAYTVTGVSAGKQRVNVTLITKVSAAEGMANAQKYKEYSYTRGKKGEKPPAPELANATGNNEIHEITAGGSHVLNLDMHKGEAPVPSAAGRGTRAK